MDASKAEVFSLGMTILEAITLENCAYLYVRNPLNIHPEKFESYINLMKSKYPTFLCNFIMTMLAKNPKQRKSFSELCEILRPFEA